MLAFMSMPAPSQPPLGIPMVERVDDETVVRDTLAWLLRSRRLLSEGFGHAEAFEAFLATRDLAGGWPVAPSCLLLDVRMPGTSGLLLFDRLVDRCLIEALPVIFLTCHGDVPTAVASIKRGAFDFVEKPFSDNALVDRVVQALAASGQATLRRRGQQSLQRSLADLTDRDRDLEVMQHVIAGLANEQIDDELDISVRTVEVPRACLFEKMNVRSAVELANLLREGPG